MKDFWLAPFVVALRLPILAQEAQNIASGKMPANGGGESKRMVTEKIDAVNDGILDACIEVTRLQMELGMMMMTGNAAGFVRAAKAAPQRIAHAATAPGNKTVRNNARRLAPF